MDRAGKEEMKDASENVEGGESGRCAMRNRLMLFISLVMILSFIASMSRTGSANEDNGTASGITFDVQAARVVGCDVGDKYDEKTGAITHKTSTFSKQSPAMHITVGVTGLTKGQEIVCSLHAVDVRDSEGKRYKDIHVASTSAKAPDSEATAHFDFSKPEKGWPVGSYSISISVRGKIIKTVDIIVK